MNVGSLFSGIGGMDAGLARAGHEHVFFCERDEWRREVLAARWPGVPIYDDVRAVGVEPAAGTQVDGGQPVADGAGWLHSDAVPGLLCGGFPCQDLSVAGKRAGLAGDRSGLFFEFARIIDALRPRFVLVENVPGLLSSQGGRDFGVVIGTLADLGYGVAWRILDSRFFGVPQRRRRVFIVGARADGDFAAAARRAGEILAVGSRCPGHPPQGGEAGADVAKSFAGRSPSRLDDAAVGGGQLISETVRSHPRPGSNSNGNIVYQESEYGVQGYDTAGTLREGRIPEHQMIVAAPLTKGSASGKGVNAPGRRQEDDVNIVAFHPTGGGAKGLSESEGVAPGTGVGNGGSVAIAYALRKDPGGTGQGHNTNYVAESGVRRLTPIECERLQGLPDDWTRLNDKTPDSRRYSALGDAVTATVSEWIGRRIA